MFNEPKFYDQSKAFGLDIGYLFTKYAVRIGENIITGSFPSVALRASGSALVSGLEGLGAREADLKIEIGDVVSDQYLGTNSFRPALSELKTIRFPSQKNTTRSLKQLSFNVVSKTSASWSWDCQ